MDIRTIFSQYPLLEEYFTSYPDNDLERLVGLLKPMQCALDLNGKVLTDLTNANTDKKLHFFASALEIKHYKGMSRATLVPAITDKFNQTFGSDAATEHNSAIPQNVIIPTLTPYDNTVIQLPLSIGAPQEFDVMEQIDLEER